MGNFRQNKAKTKRHLDMATKQQTGRNAPSSARPAGVRPVYEEFRPNSEWKQEEQSVVLLVYLPGFSKEQIRIYMERTNTLRIQGERLVGGNKWSRFEEEFRVPDECNIPEIRANFAGGTLTVIMPKKSPLSSQIGPRQVAKMHTTDKPMIGKAREDIPPPTSGAGKKADDKSFQSPPGPRETASATKNQRDQDNIPPKITSSTISEGKQKDGKVVEEPTARTQMGHGESETPLKTTSKVVGEKHADGKVVGSEGAAKTVQETVKTKERSDGQGRKLADSKMPNTGLEKTVQKEEESKGRGKESIDFEPENAIKKIAKKENEEGEGSVSVGKEKTAYDSSDVAEERQTMTIFGGRGSAAGDFRLEKYKKAMMELVGKGNLVEERQLLVNIGTAVLVIVALGAYISYTWSSSGKPKD